MSGIPGDIGNLLSDAMAKLHKAAVVDAKADVNRIPEQLFVQWFLPYFAGDLTGELADRVFSDWMRVAKNQFGEVIVFDENNQDLFRVPAMASTRVFNPMGNNNTRALADIITLANQRTHISPVQGQEYLTQSLLKKFDTMLDKKHIHSDQENVWRSIFARYNVPLKNPDGTTSAAQALAANPAKPSDFAEGELVF